MNRSNYLIALLVIISFASCLKSKDDIPKSPDPPKPPQHQTVFEWNKIADSAQASLSLFYYPAGRYYLKNNNATPNAGDDGWVQYWPTAHVLDVLVDGLVRTGTASYKTKMEDLLAGMYIKNGNRWVNHYYDDMEWMGLASLRAFQATNDTRYTDVINVIWPDIKNGWSADLDGGIWWNKDRGSKNACSNGPAAILGARLYKQFGNTADLDFAKQVYSWEKTKLYNATSGAVYDHIDKNGIIQSSPGWIFTYNQGTFLGAAYELYKITNDAAYLADAVKAADYTISNLVTNGLLKSEGGGDGGLFKGIFVRYLAQLIIDGGLQADKRTSYINFLKKNAETMWAKATNKQYSLFDASWETKPGAQTDLTVQLSGIMLVEAVNLLKKNGLM